MCFQQTSGIGTTVTILIALKLQFDGSLRRPTDPNPDIISSSISSSPSFLAPFASCSSVLYIKEEEEEYFDDLNNSHTYEENHYKRILSSKDASRGFKIVALGSKGIPTVSGTTSADVEYEGLILALNLLLNYSSEKNVTSNMALIQGDCKTIIDQMNLKSKARKLYQYYHQAQDLLKILKLEYDITCEFEHIKRDNNSLCDSMCQWLIKKLQFDEIENLITSIRKIQDETNSETMRRKYKLPTSKKKRYRFQKTLFHHPLNEVSGWDPTKIIPISLRPYFLCSIYLASSHVDDFVAMRLVGEAMVKESQLWERNSVDSIQVACDITGAKRMATSEAMKVIGIKMVYTSLRKMDLIKEAEKYLEFTLKTRSPFHRTSQLNHLIITQDQVQDFMNIVPDVQNLKVTMNLLDSATNTNDIGNSKISNKSLGTYASQWWNDVNCVQSLLHTPHLKIL